MKERPILFSGEMVSAILSGAKTMTRRIVKLNAAGRVQLAGHQWHLDDPEAFNACPYGKVGDRLWVRETHATVGVPNGTTANKFYTVYRADNPQGLEIPSKWKPSIFMRRHDSRITLEITGVRVERLNEISGGDVVAEGVFQHSERNSDRSEVVDLNYLRSIFHRLWDKINGKKHPWASNPWVWVVEFKRENQ